MHDDTTDAATAPAPASASLDYDSEHEDRLACHRRSARQATAPRLAAAGQLHPGVEDHARFQPLQISRARRGGRSGGLLIPPATPLQRRQWLGLAGLALAAPRAMAQTSQALQSSAMATHGTMPFAAPLPLVPMKARADRIIDIAVCLRPFRAQGPRIEAQRIGSQVVVHNYGHGGSGWSLSWGSARLAVQLALQAAQPGTRVAGSRHLAVIGCGAIGLTSAIVAQRAGWRVRIFCRDRPPEVASLAASGVWSPSSRICASDHADTAFVQRWQTITRESHHVFQSMLGLADHPVEWTEGYVLSDIDFNKPMPESPGGANEPDYAHLMGEVPELRQRSQALQPHEHPFPVPHVRRYTQMVFNLPAYTRLLLEEFQRNGGSIELRDFESPRQFAQLKERTLINATGFGAKALLGDKGLVPVRGQTARLMPQPEAHYGITWRGHNLAVVPRRDGILVQAQGDNDYGNTATQPDRAESEAAVQRLATLFPP